MCVCGDHVYSVSIVSLGRNSDCTSYMVRKSCDCECTGRIVSLGCSLTYSGSVVMVGRPHTWLYGEEKVLCFMKSLYDVDKFILSMHVAAVQ